MQKKYAEKNTQKFSVKTIFIVWQVNKLHTSVNCTMYFFFFRLSTNAMKPENEVLAKILNDYLMLQ